MVLFLAFFPRRSDSEQLSSHSNGTDEELPKPRDAIIVGATCLVALLVAGVGSLFFLVRAPSQLLGWANFLGVTASILASVQYIPQIWTTYKLGKVLSLSIVTMLIQVPGAFVFAFSLYLRVGGQGWSSWLVYCVTGLFQGILLAMAIRFWINDRASGQASAAYTEDRAASERDPLLQNSAESPSRSLDTSDSPSIAQTRKGNGRLAAPVES
ncbi:PQ loop repeat-containing protein 7 [Elsinoe fawcettii]|nr:PQ loop repeat-containing protein 7 [Elsinoe fawcettii]